MSEAIEDGVEASLLADLYDTIDLQDTSMKVSVGLEIAEALVGTDKARAMELFGSICRNLYWLSYFEHVYEKENFSEVLAFAKKHKFKIDDQVQASLGGAD